MGGTGAFDVECTGYQTTLWLPGERCQCPFRFTADSKSDPSATKAIQSYHYCRAPYMSVSLLLCDSLTLTLTLTLPGYCFTIVSRPHTALHFLKSRVRLHLNCTAIAISHSSNSNPTLRYGGLRNCMRCIHGDAPFSNHGCTRSTSIWGVYRHFLSIDKLLELFFSQKCTGFFSQTLWC